MTAQGDHRETTSLTCPEPLARASRSSDPNSTASHRGHNPLLMDGDVTLAYQHHPVSTLSRTDSKGDEGESRRRRGTRVRRLSSTNSTHKRTKRASDDPRSRLESNSISSSTGSLLTVEASQVEDASGSGRGRGRRRYSPAAALTRLRTSNSASVLRSPASAGRDEVNTASASASAAASAPLDTNHNLIPTNFTIATICDFCHSKIWTRKAFGCDLCSLVCHRKCIGKFQADAPCSRTKPTAAPTGSTNDRPDSSTASSATTKEEGESKVNPPTSLNTGSTLTDRATSRLKSPIRLGPDGLLAEAGGFSINLRTPKSPTKEAMRGLLGKGMARLGGSPRPSPAPSVQNSPDLNRQLESEDNTSPTGEQVRWKEPSPGYQIPTSSSSSSEEKFVGGRENEEMLSKLMSKCGLDAIKADVEIGAHDEVVVSMAKSTGKELFADLPPVERKEKLEEMTSKLQLAIDAESENRSDLARELKRVPTEDLKAKQRIEAAVQKSEDKMQSMAVLMLHYCSGLADCLENFDSEKEESDSDEEENLENDNSRRIRGNKARRQVEEDEQEEGDDEYEEVLETSRSDERRVEEESARDVPLDKDDNDDDNDGEKKKNYKDAAHLPLKAKDSIPLRTSQLSGDDLRAHTNQTPYLISDADDGPFLSTPLGVDRRIGFKGDADGEESVVKSLEMAPNDAPRGEGNDRPQEQQQQQRRRQLEDNEANIVELLSGDDRVEELRGESTGGLGDNFSGASEASEAEEALDD